MSDGIIIAIYLSGAIGGLLSIPILKGYHKAKYGSEYDSNHNEFDLIPDPYDFALISITWPIAIQIIMISKIVVVIGIKVGRILRGIGSSLAGKKENYREG